MPGGAFVLALFLPGAITASFYECVTAGTDAPEGVPFALLEAQLALGSTAAGPGGGGAADAPLSCPLLQEARGSGAAALAGVFAGGGGPSAPAVTPAPPPLDPLDRVAPALTDPAEVTPPSEVAAAPPIRRDSALTSLLARLRGRETDTTERPQRPPTPQRRPELPADLDVSFCSSAGGALPPESPPRVSEAPPPLPSPCRSGSAEPQPTATAPPEPLPQHPLLQKLMADFAALRTQVAIAAREPPDVAAAAATPAALKQPGAAVAYPSPPDEQGSKPSKPELSAAPDQAWPARPLLSAPFAAPPSGSSLQRITVMHAAAADDGGTAMDWPDPAGGHAEVANAGLAEAEARLHALLAPAPHTYSAAAYQDPPQAAPCEPTFDAPASDGEMDEQGSSSDASGDAETVASEHSQCDASEDEMATVAVPDMLAPELLMDAAKDKLAEVTVPLPELQVDASPLAGRDSAVAPLLLVCGTADGTAILDADQGPLEGLRIHDPDDHAADGVHGGPAALDDPALRYEGPRISEGAAEDAGWEEDAALAAIERKYLAA